MSVGRVRPTTRIAIVGGFSLAFLVSPAFADSRETRDQTEEPSGIYFRLGAGAGVFVGPDSQFFSFYNGSFWGGGSIPTTVVGFSIPGEIALGARVAGGLVVGGGLFVEGVPVLENYADPRSVGIIGPTLDYYFQRRAGLHLQALGGVGGTLIRELTVAPGVGGGVGYEWSVAPAWNLGVSARTLVLIAEAPTVTPGLLLTSTLW